MPSKTALHMRYQFPVQADYEIRVSLGGVRPETAPPVKMVFWVDGRQIQDFEVVPQRDKKRSFEMKLPVLAGSHLLSAAFVNDDFDPAQNPIAARDRYLAIETFEIRGPFNAVAPPVPASHKLLISCGHALGQHDPSCARESCGDDRASGLPPSPDRNGDEPPVGVH